MYSEWAKDEIRIDRLEIFAHHGVFPEEARDGQIFYVNATFYTDVPKACEEDGLFHRLWRRLFFYNGVDAEQHMQAFGGSCRKAGKSAAVKI